MVHMGLHMMVHIIQVVIEVLPKCLISVRLKMNFFKDQGTLETHQVSLLDFLPLKIQNKELEKDHNHIIPKI